MRIKKNYKPDPSKRISTFYGTVHHDVKEIAKQWDAIGPKHSLEDYFGKKIRELKNNKRNTDEDVSEK